jgi:hypothetical protein
LPDGKLQGFCVFAPQHGLVSLVAAVDGSVYVSQYPFKTTQLLAGVNMSAEAEQVFFATAQQGLQRNQDGSLSFLPVPKSVLIIQSGRSAPAYYDGSRGAHIRGTDVTPVGTAMVWSGSRLWVARGNRVFASDFANPFSFVEQYYLGGSDSLVMPANVTAMTEVTGLSALKLLVFTATDTISIQSNVLSRELWPETPNFQLTIFPGVGCVSARSICAQAGFLWWVSAEGLVSLDTARMAQITTSFPSIESGMGAFKRFSHNRRGAIAAVSVKDFLLMSMPYGSRLNKHTWALDNSVFRIGEQAAPSAWASVWTGFSPVDWAAFVDEARQRVFAACTTEGEQNSVHEFLLDTRRDSGQDIECAVELRALTGNTLAQKTAKWVYLTVSDVSGEVDIRVDWRGAHRGRYKQCLSGRFLAAEGSFNPAVEVAADTPLFALHPQFRRVRTRQIDTAPEDDLTTRCRETRWMEARDWAYSFLVRWNGDLALREVQPVYMETVEATAGECLESEDASVFVRFDGAATDSMAELEDAVPESYTAFASVSGEARGVTASASRVRESLISAQAAQKMAQQAASAQVGHTLVAIAPPVYSQNDVV